MQEKDFYKQNYYEALGIDKNASKQDVKKAFYAKSKIYHPDICKDKDATEKFKFINQAYQTLYDDDTRREYDQSLNSTTAKTFKSNYFDVRVLDQFMNKSFSSEEFIKFLSKYNIEQVFYLFEYFWITFWSGRQSTENMLKFRTASILFKEFINFNGMKKIVNETIKTFGNEQKKVFDECNNVYRAYLEKDVSLFENYKNDSKNVKYFNYMIDIINNDNIFDFEIIPLIVFSHSEKTLQLISIFENIYNDNCHYKNETIRLTHNDKMSKKINNRARLTSIAMIGILIVISIILAIFFIKR